MKKIYALLLTAIMAFSLTACSTAGERENSFSVPPLISTTTESETSTSSGSTDNVLQSTSQAESDDTTSSTTTESKQPEQSSETVTENSTPTTTLESSNESKPTPEPTSTSTSSTESEPVTEPTTTSTSTTESKPVTEPTSTSTSTPISTTESIPVTTPEPETSKVLVAYFSATNTTEGVAERIADVLDADIYEIMPETPYTSADLNYRSDSSRSTIEMNDPNSRPAISGSVTNMDQYDIVFIGYPIWWGEAPRILNTFVESYDFSGKTVVPFCTSGGSGVGSSARNLARLTSGANWLDGTRLNGSASENDIVRWINGLGLDVAA